MLSVQTKNIIKATVPVLEQHGVTITKTFYQNMLSENPTLLNTFNRVNQKKGRQPTALAMTVLAAAKNIDDLSVLLPAVNQIGHKHRALQVKPEQYDIVGKYLLLAIKEVLGAAATPEIINAWADTYKVIADIFIGVEKEMYKSAAWPAWEKFVVTEKTRVTDEIMEFAVKPASGSNLDLAKLKIIPGQYLTVKTHPTAHDNQYDALRHYSICSDSTKDGLKFSVKYEHGNGVQDGLVSEYLHKSVKVGDIIELSAPAGDFELNQELIKQNEIPLVLVSAGVGATPLVAMLEFQQEHNPNRPVLWIQSSKDENSQAFKPHVSDLLSKFKNARSEIVYTDNMPRIDNKFLETHIPDHSDVYICGSMEFMSSIMDALKELGHKENMVHYEPFGPKMSL